jgi:predicted amidohydrolase
MRVHLVQLDIRWEDPVANRARAGELIAAAGPSAGDLVILPEMFDTGFSFAVDRTADRDGGTRGWLVATARRHGCTVLGGFTMPRGGGGATNRALAAGPDGLVLAEYDKRRLFPLGTPSEADRLTPGDRVAVFRWESGAGSRPLSVAPVVCYDLRFPELFGAGLTEGAEAFAVIANWPAERAGHWRALLVARAIENQAWVFGVNRAGADPSLRYAGGSIVIGPRGEVAGEADERERVLSVEIDRTGLDDWRARFPAWRARTTNVSLP